jgi:hypothetical protein
MRHLVLLRAFDSTGDVVSETSYAAATPDESVAYEQEFIDRLERRSVPFVRVVKDISIDRSAPRSAKRPMPKDGSYIGLQRGFEIPYTEVERLYARL